MRFLNVRYAVIPLMIAIVGFLDKPTQVIAHEGKHTSDTLERVFEQLCADTGKSSVSFPHAQHLIVLDTLKQLPPEEVIPAVADALTNDDRFRVVAPRRALYAILAQLDARNDERALEQLLAGLIEEDSYIAVSCATAIAKTSEHSRKKAVRELIAKWNGPDLDPPVPGQSLAKALDRYKTILKALAVFGPSAKDFFEIAVHLFCSEELVFEERVVRLRDIMSVPKSEFQVGEGRTARSSVAYRLRAAALRTIYGLGGVEEIVILAERDDLDEDAQQMIVGSFASLGARSKGTFHTDAAHRDRIREIVLRGMTSPFENVRKAALQSLVWPFGDDWVLIRSESDYEINPQIKTALEDMAANDHDPELRQRAGIWLKQLEDSYLDRAVKGILEKRQGIQARPAAKEDAE